MENQLKCIYCESPAYLVEDEMTLAKGMVKVKVEASHYLCSSCRRTFRTKEQSEQTDASLHKNKVKINEEKDMVAKKQRARYSSKYEKPK